MALETVANEVGAAIWKRVIEFSQAPTPTTARALLRLQFPQQDRQRMSELAVKARAGTLTALEERETETYERLGCLLDIVHSEARRVFKRRRSSTAAC